MLTLLKNRLISIFRLSSFILYLNKYYLILLRFLVSCKLIMNNQKNPSSRTLHKQKLKEKRLKKLAARLKSNIVKRKQSKKLNK